MVKSPYVFDQAKQSRDITLHIYDTDFNYQGIVRNYRYLKWQEHYHGRGDFVLHCTDTDDNIAKLQEGWYVTIGSKDTAMVIRYNQKSTEDKLMIVKGFTTVDLINQRAIWQTESVYKAEADMYKIVRNSSRGMPYLALGTVQGFPEVFDTQFTGGNVVEALVSVCTETGLGFQVKFDDEQKRHIFTVYKGRDLSYENSQGNPYKVFSPEFRNLVNATVTDDLSIFRNVAFVAGEGEGSERKWLEVNSGNVTGLNRFELFVDARDLQSSTYIDGEEVHYTPEQYEKMLYARGIEKLNQHNRVMSFQGEVSPNGFGADFYLGDIITCESPRYGVSMDTRIMEYAQIRENNMTKLVLTLGEPEISAAKRIKLG